MAFRSRSQQAKQLPSPDIPLARSNISTPLQARVFELKTALKGLKASLYALPPLGSAVGELEECIARMQVWEQSCSLYDELLSDLTSQANLLKSQLVVKSRPRNVSPSIVNVAKSIAEKTSDIKLHQDPSRTSRLVMSKQDEKIVAECYLRIVALFQHLQADISLSIWDEVQEQQLDARLNDLLPSHEAYYNAPLSTTVTTRDGCAPETRRELLASVRDWIWENNGGKIYWLNGISGTGKTTIAYSVCMMLQARKRLGASFFCSRNSPDCRDVSKIVPTIAYQLGQYSNPYRQRLCNVLDEDPDVIRRSIGTQFERLISKPLATIGSAMPGNVVVVIDALDECTEVDGTKAMLDILLRHAGNLPVKFFVTSRPETTIDSPTTTKDGAMRSILQIHDIGRSPVQADIKSYLTQALARMKVLSSEIDALADRADSLFIFAATAVRYITPSIGSMSRRQGLRRLLRLRPSGRNKRYKDIDDLYVAILAEAFDEKKFEKGELAQRRSLLWSVVCAREPLTVLALAALLGVPVRAVEMALFPLQSVLYVSDAARAVSTFHASFSDFLLDKQRAGRFHCDETTQSAYLAELCFQIMGRSLRFNICRLESSYIFDQDVPDLKDRVDRAVSTELFYACRYWGDHLIRCPPSPKLMLLLDTFLQYHLLFWMEVLNLTGQIGRCESVLGQALARVPDGGFDEIRHLAYDARNFVYSFAASPAARSTPHIYISALPFVLSDSRICANYWLQTKGLLALRGGAIATKKMIALATCDVGVPILALVQPSKGEHMVSCASDAGVVLWNTLTGDIRMRPPGDSNRSVWSLALSQSGSRVASSGVGQEIYLWSSGKLGHDHCRGHTGLVLVVALSPDGTTLASGSEDCSIRMWDADNGIHLGTPLEGHRSTIASLAFSPSGHLLASGGYDSTVRIWDWRQGTPIVQPLTGHTDCIYSIAFCPDGLRLASGSRDCTIHVWGVHSASLLLAPLKGHAHSVSSVAFSPDGSKLVSGSWDHTICLWNLSNGHLLAGPIIGHYGWVNSVCFSVDGTRIISGSADGTIRTWDATQELVLKRNPTTKAGAIRSIAFSADCQRAALGSSDCMVYVRDIMGGTLICGPLQGHTEEITSVAFSPDNARIVSTSNDRTIRAWDANTGSSLVGPLEGHAGWVRSGLFSPDGQHIASCSDDRTIRVWNADTGRPAAGPFEGHTDVVMSIAFSPNITSNRIVSGSADQTIRMWDTHNGNAPIWVSDKHGNRVNCVAFSLDGRRVVSGSNDQTILVWDSEDGRVLYGPFIGHTHWIRSVIFSPDGSQIVSSSLDATIRVWNVQNGTAVSVIQGQLGRIKHAAFSLTGKQVISGSEDGIIRLWDIATPDNPNSAVFDGCIIKDDGWMVNSESELLFWVPPDLRTSLPLPSSPLVSCPTGKIEADYHDLLLGKNWKRCYPQSRVKHTHDTRDSIAPLLANPQGVLRAASAYLRVINLPYSALSPLFRPLQTPPWFQYHPESKSAPTQHRKSKQNRKSNLVVS